MEPSDRQKRNAERLAARAHAIRSLSTIERDALAFMGQPLVQLTLPHEDPGDIDFYERTNGDLSLVVEPGTYKAPDGRVRRAGVPFGVYPRLVLAWITTEAVRSGGGRVISLGPTLTAFMRELGLGASGGADGPITLMRDQLRRLFSARIAVLRGGASSFERSSMQLARQAKLWWDPKRPDEPVMFTSTVELSEEFYRMLVERPVPIDMDALKALKSSPLGLDLYMWLTYRVSYMKRETPISWKQLEAQMGSNYSDTKNFARSVKRELKKIKLVWPELKLGVRSQGFMDRISNEPVRQSLPFAADELVRRQPFECLQPLGVVVLPRALLQGTTLHGKGRYQKATSVRRSGETTPGAPGDPAP